MAGGAERAAPSRRRLRVATVKRRRRRGEGGEEEGGMADEEGRREREGEEVRRLWVFVFWGGRGGEEKESNRGGSNEGEKGKMHCLTDGWSCRTIVHDNGERLERWREFRGRSLGSFESRQPFRARREETSEQQEQA